MCVTLVNELNINNDDKSPTNQPIWNLFPLYDFKTFHKKKYDAKFAIHLKFVLVIICREVICNLNVYEKSKLYYIVCLNVKHKIIVLTIEIFLQVTWFIWDVISTNYMRFIWDIILLYY